MYFFLKSNQVIMNIETKVFNECQRMDLWLTNQKVAAETRELAVWFEEKKNSKQMAKRFILD